MAEISVYYRLSAEGKAAALLAGRNAGDMQRIILRSPGHVQSEAPADVVARIMGWKLPEVSESPATLLEAVKGLAEATTLLVQVLNPEASLNVVVEDATPDLWELAVSLALTYEKGNSSVACGFDSEYGSVTTGYTVVFDQKHSRFKVDSTRAYRHMDRLYTAAELLPTEGLRRATLEVCAKNANAEAAEKMQEYNATKAAEALEWPYRRAVDFLEANSEFSDLPEVAALAALVAAGERTAFLDRGGEKSPLAKAEAAKAEAKVAASRAMKGEWIAEHGSALLRRLFEEGLDIDSQYADERLAIECPGWVWGGAENRGGYARKPTLAEYEWYDVVKATSPDAVLGLVGGDNGKCVPVRRYMNRTIYRP